MSDEPIASIGCRDPEILKGKPPVEAFARLRAMSGMTLAAGLVEGFIAEVKEGGMPERHA